MTNEHWLLVSKLCWVIVGGFVLYLVWIACRQEKASNQYVKNYSLQVWRENVVPAFIAHTHLKPFETFQLTEECINKSLLFTEAQLGITLEELLGHAVICQRYVLSAVKKELQVAEFYLESLRADKEIPPDKWKNA